MRWSVLVLALIAGLAWMLVGCRSPRETESRHPVSTLPPLPFGHDLRHAQPLPPGQEPADLAPWFENSLGQRMLLVRGGTFEMGADGGYEDSRPAHAVRLTSYYLAQTETTREQFRRFVAATGSGADLEELDPTAIRVLDASNLKGLHWRYGAGQDDEVPMFAVPWSLAVRFTEWLSRIEGRRYRLPTEAEWEYAARAGTPTTHSTYWGPTSSDIDRGIGQYGGRAASPYSGLAKPGTYPANPWGFHEVLGNAAEWTLDWYSVGYPRQEGPRVNPTGASRGPKHVRRGGSFISGRHLCNLWYRGSGRSDDDGAGIRLVCEITSDFREPPASPVPPLPATLRERAEQARQVPRIRVPLAEGVDLELIELPPGEVVLGSPESERGRSLAFESPRTTAVITRGFAMGVYELTQAQFQAVMGTNPSRHQGPLLPIHDVTYLQAIEFGQVLTQRERAAGRLDQRAVYRLPTDAEWEYACRAGTTTAYSFGDDQTLLPHFAWFGAPTSHQPVGGKLPNVWGFFDMHGNVAEWVLGSLVNYPGGSVEDPFIGKRGSYFTVRGGGVGFQANACRSAFRHVFLNLGSYEFLGFRIIRTMPGDDAWPFDWNERRVKDRRE